MMKIKTSLLALAAVLASSASASAADLYSPAPANDVGLYIGVIGGYGWGDIGFSPTGDYASNSVPSSSFDVDGGLVGGQIGYDFVLSDSMFLGVVGDMSWSNQDGSVCVETSGGGCDGSADDSYALGSVDWLATLRGKVGFMSGNAQIYGTAGLAIADGNATVTNIDGLTDFTDSNTHVGWTVGAGAAYKLSENVSVGAEYLYVDLGTKSYDFSGSLVQGSISGGADVSLDMHVVRGSLNFHF